MQYELKTPGLWPRMACWVYEGMPLFGVGFITGYLFCTLTQTRQPMDHRHALQGFVFVVFGIYFVWFWAKGQTLAMKTWNIRLVDASGQALTQPRALLRYCLSWVWFLPSLLVMAALPVKLAGAELAGLLAIWVVIWAFLSRLQPQGHFWHDVLAGTRLVELHPLRP